MRLVSVPIIGAVTSIALGKCDDSQWPGRYRRAMCDTAEFREPRRGRRIGFGEEQTATLLDSGDRLE